MGVGGQGREGGREECRQGGEGNRHSPGGGRGGGTKTNKSVQKTGEEKRNKMDKQEKNRKPVNQGKSYMCLHPGADLYHAPHRPGNVGATLGPSAVRCPRDCCSPLGGASPHLPVHTSHAPYNTSWSSLPRAVCERYKPDRRCSSPGVRVSGPLSSAWKSGPSPALNPQVEASCIPLYGVSAAGGGGWR